MKTFTRIIMAISLYGYASAGMKTIPRVLTGDVVLLWAAVLMACLVCIQAVITGKIFD
ncbi:hypothetical protein ACQZ46_02505 [Agrobacterium salinitolerans]